MKSLTQYTSRLKETNRKSLVTYLTAGLEGWIDAIHCAIENGADLVEVGLPFSDPVMDGPVIAHASAVALSKGAKTLDLLKSLEREKFAKPISIMTYANVLYSHGFENILDPISKAGISGLILPDLTFESSLQFIEILKQTDISLIQLVASTTNPERRNKIIQQSEGFLYCIAIKGITGQNVDLSESYTNFIAPIREKSILPVYCGVGIRSVEDAKTLSKLSDGVIVGTTLVEILMNSDKPIESLGKFVRQLRTSIDE